MTGGNGTAVWHDHHEKSTAIDVANHDNDDYNYENNCFNEKYYKIISPTINDSSHNFNLDVINNKNNESDVKCSLTNNNTNNNNNSNTTTTNNNKKISLSFATEWLV